MTTEIAVFNVVAGCEQNDKSSIHPGDPWYTDWTAYTIGLGNASSTAYADTEQQCKMLLKAKVCLALNADPRDVDIIYMTQAALDVYNDISDHYSPIIVTNFEDD